MLGQKWVVHRFLVLSLYPRHPAVIFQKDFFGFILILCLYLLQTHFGISSFSHPDNALEVCGLLTPLHIVPEWYFLCQYAMLKAVPNKNAGFIILLTSIFTFFFLLYFYNWIPCPLQINSFWNLGFLLGITIILAVVNKILSDTRFYDPWVSKKWVWMSGESKGVTRLLGRICLLLTKFLVLLCELQTLITALDKILLPSSYFLSISYFL